MGFGSAPGWPGPTMDGMAWFMDSSSLTGFAFFSG